MSKLKLKGIIVLSIFIFQFLFPSCDPEAKWVTGDVDIHMTVNTVSAGFVECSFSTNREAYYLIAIEQAREGVNPLDRPKQFMMLALDSANVEYLKWRNERLKQGEFNIAPFASHALQYGDVDYFFTGLLPGNDYWIYAFVVNPETLQPSGKLHLQKVTTADDSQLEVHFDYRIKGRWDYIYPMDTLGNIYSRFPYIATTRDSLTLVGEGLSDDGDAVLYFVAWMMDRFLDPSLANILYGVYAVENDGWQSSEDFQEGHTYYTAIGGYDGSFKQTTIYKFVWTGDSCNLYLRDTDEANIINL